MATLEQTQILGLSVPTEGNIVGPVEAFFIGATSRLPFAGEPFMTPERWQQAKAIFQQALELPPDERADFISNASAGDDLVHAEVGLLLEAHDRKSGFSLATERLLANVAATLVATCQLPMRCPDCGARYTDGASVCAHDGAELVKDPADLAGTTLDETYRIVRLLGRGGVGVVYLAEHALLHDRVAIKVLPRAATAHAESFRRFLREGQMARAIRHPNVVSVLELRSTNDGTTYMVMEYVEGPTLREAMRSRGKFTLDEALCLLEPVVAALDHAHGLGIVHRDLKPDNVIIGGEPGVPGVKLLDLGLARLFDTSTTDAGSNMTTAGQILGTPPYMPPEQWGELPSDGGSNIDARTDIYSLGVMLFEMVAGRLPFEGTTSHALRVALTRQTPPALSDVAANVPHGASEAVARALAKDRSGRQATAGQFLAEVRADAGQNVPSVSETEIGDPRRGRLGSTVRSATRIAAAVVATSLVFVVALVVLGMLPPGGDSTGVPKSRPAATAVDVRTLSVKLLAQRMRGGVTRIESFAPSDELVFGSGDGIRVEATTSHNGYLYVVNEAPTLDAATALPRYTVIHPKFETRGGSPRVDANDGGGENAMTTGQIVELPTPYDSPPQFTIAQSGNAHLIAEEVIVLVTPKPLELEIGPDQLRLSNQTLDEWERRWGGPVERFDYEDGAGMLYTTEEKSARNDPRYRLRRDGPAPQVLFRIPDGNNRPVFLRIKINVRAAEVSAMQTRPMERVVSTAAPSVLDLAPLVPGAVTHSACRSLALMAPVLGRRHRTALSKNTIAFSTFRGWRQVALTLRRGLVTSNAGMPGDVQAEHTDSRVASFVGDGCGRLCRDYHSRNQHT